ncbi:RNA-binding protein [Agriterribacter sp.]|uniref:RNA recognition motif domain-containing protein n=1 Tax=Agriterribacter sp. TaxID=2821509 RepID=UPI002BEB5849|nr:RNA-binding protein [Agriterribacter sp.]HTN06857.1 RNA-binding protein [Agriterribacter sp.]
MNIYVSNLSFAVVDADLVKQFSQYGEVNSVNIIMDKITNRSRGFAFVDMPENSAAEKAIRELNGASLDGRVIKVNEARQKEDRNKSSSY